LGWRAYPDRIVDHLQAGAYARTQIYTVRAARSHKPTSDAIQNRHGSRKSGIAQVGRVRAKKKLETKASTQGSFEF
jgi:deoxyribodipyrimidine photo-lyase